MRLNGTSPADGTRLAHQVEGELDAPPLLLLQGQANDHTWWRTVRPLLVDDFCTITFDYRGTGRTARLQAESGTPDESEWSTRSFAGDCLAVLDALGVERAHVYGTSMGGRIAQELAIAHPERLDRMALACTTPGKPAAVERNNDVRKALANPDRTARLHATVDFFYTASFVAAHGGPDHAPRHLFGDRTMSPADALRHLRVSNGHDAADRLHRITTPTLVLHGADDPMAPAANARILGDLIRSSTVEVRPGRHGFFDEDATAVTDLVRDHLLHP